jgi:uncharacterized protein YbaA (DUF1428 family)
MAQYVDGFLLCVPKKKLGTYKRIAKQAGNIWRKHGAIEYRECTADELKLKGPAAFEKRAGAKKDEVVVFSWIVYPSKAARNRANAKVMKDPAILSMMSLVQGCRQQPPQPPRT